MQEQNYKNHGRMVTGFHYVLFGITLVTFFISSVNLYQKIQAGEGLLEPLMFIFLTISVLLVAWFARTFPLKAQDRAIRAEENFRHYLLTGKPLDSALRMGQIIALRFASDSELPELAQKAVSEDLGNKAIKEQIKNWKQDNNRV